MVLEFPWNRQKKSNYSFPRPKNSLETYREGEEEKPREKSDEVDLSSLNLIEDLSKVSEKTLIDGIIRPRLNELFTMIGLEIKKSGFVGQTPSGIVITGGGAQTIGVSEAARRMLAMPVRVGTPTNIKGIIDEIQYPSFATVIGLTMYGGTIETTSSLPFGFSFPSLPFNLKTGNKFFSKAISFIKSFLP